MPKLLTRYTVILLSEPNSCESGICYDDSGRKPAYFVKEIDAQDLANDLNNRHLERDFVVGTITYSVDD